MKWYGSKEKAMEAIMQSTGNKEEIKQEQDENAKIYKQFMAAKEADNMDMASSAVEMLAENYKTIFVLDNARNILLDLAKEYLQGGKLAEATDSLFGIRRTYHSVLLRGITYTPKQNDSELCHLL